MIIQLPSGGTTAFGTADGDLIIAEADYLFTPQTIHAGGGDDVVIGDMSPFFVDDDPGNDSFATAMVINGLGSWTTLDNPFVEDSSVAHTSVLAEGDDAYDYFRVQVGFNELITIDVDFGIGTEGRSSFDSAIRLFDSSFNEVARNDDASDNAGGLGSFGEQDAFLTYQNKTGGQTFYIRVGESKGPVPDSATYLLNVSVTNHPEASVGFWADDTIFGGAGDDYLHGMGGDDLIAPGPGDDEIFGGEGFDTIDYSDAASAVTFSLGFFAGQATGGSGTDEAQGFEGLIGTAFDDTLTGSNGDDVIEGGAGEDMIDGGLGSDTVSYASSSQGVSVVLSSVTPLATGGDAEGDVLTSIENLIGSDGTNVDALRGGLEANRLEGLGGNDGLVGGGGQDQLFGGDGDDSLSINGLAYEDGSVFDGGAGTDTLALALSDGVLDFRTSTLSSLEILSFPILTDHDLIFHASQFTFEEVEAPVVQSAQPDGSMSNSIALTVYMDGSGPLDLDIDYTDTDLLTGVDVFGSSGDDTVAGGEIAVTFYGYNGADTFSGGIGGDFAAGGNGDDVFAGGDGADMLNGGGGIDDLDGGAGDDTINAGSGNDIVFGDTGDDVIGGQDGDDDLDGGIGNDTLNGADGNDHISGGSGDDEINGGVGDDTAYGSGDNDTIRGLTGDDLLVGGLGTDTIYGARGEDTIYGDFVGSSTTGDADIIYAGADSDTIFGRAGTDEIYAQAGDDSAFGEGGDDTINGAAGSDTVDGGEGNDLLRGGSGEDVLRGGLGNDELSGQGGFDTYLFHEEDDGNDTVLGFSAGDTVKLVDFGYGTAEIAEASFFQSGNDVGFSFAGVSITFVNADLAEVRDAILVEETASAISAAGMSPDHWGPCSVIGLGPFDLYGLAGIEPGWLLP